MTEFLTPQQLARRTGAAVDAAVAAGRERGLTVTDAEVLHDLFSVVVHLSPAPVVARIPTVLAPGTDPAEMARRQQAELDVTRWLDEQGTPVLAPSPLVPREPVRRDGFCLTLWQFVEQVADTEPDYVVNAERTAELHAALRSYPGRLPFLSAADPDSITASLHALDDRPDLAAAADVDRARREWQVLEPLVRSRAAFADAFPGIDLQPLHGDSPPANLFAGVDGYRFADFELVTFGPVEWDLAGIGPELTAAYDRGARRAGMRELDPGVLRFVNAVGMVRIVASLALVPQQPVLAQYLQPAVEQWRDAPFAGGMAG
ncbi:aminoglycoside phosphotransferase family protein [Saccharopolyspora sp. HNM0983]|uniref:Aminoglycoside phosphotransferase family protein n=1 Tax=Saccharopolyspora montiporae TaxID=2781240 RepID=A0A929B8K8_9PSEU|nr:phosphotransferase [Saccharopolyspora sp. HNM0983]MBE9373558.1 aminoglycoside phosphotransferase family protein [Saccharopolyspora sp. HNM0983]